MNDASFQFAGFWRRLVAQLVDFGILWVIGIPLFAILMSSQDFRQSFAPPNARAGVVKLKIGLSHKIEVQYTESKKVKVASFSEFVSAVSQITPFQWLNLIVISGLSLDNPFNFFINWILMACLFVFFWTTWQATPGKMIMGLVIVDSGSGLKPSSAQCLVRYLGYFPSKAIFLLYFIIGIHPRKQGLHDMLANTVVVRKGTIDQNDGVGDGTSVPDEELKLSSSSE